MSLLDFVIIICFVSITQPLIYGNPNKNLRVKSTNEANIKSPMRYFLPNAKGIQPARSFQDRLSNDNHIINELAADSKISEEGEQMDDLGFRRREQHDKHGLNRQSHSELTDGTISTSEEIMTWKTEWLKAWNLKKIDAILAPIANQSQGDVINMAAARPWTLPCGDPNQHDVPWGTCTHPYDCDPDFRIFRGDIFCGQTKFICCAAQNTDRDMYQAFDISLADTSYYSTSSEEKFRQDRGSRENRRLRRAHKKNRIIKARYRKKRKIKKHIRDLEKEIRKELNRAFRNNTRERRKTTLRLKVLIRKMKQKFRKERAMAMKKHDFDLAKISHTLNSKLDKVKALNYNFLKNDTFREIIVNGTGPRAGLKSLLSYTEMDEYPELEQELKKLTRRSGGRLVGINKRKKPNDYLDYDVEVGIINLYNKDIVS